jgi:secondary thiamine-phosphate synthase enzyme
MVKKLSVHTRGQGLWEITDQAQKLVADSGIPNGICTLFVQHTSASLTIQENADPSARYDLEKWINRFVPENDPHYTHLLEGADDMPSHIKSAITSTSLSVPIINGRLALGTWQGIFLWEHRKSSHTRSIIAYLGE